MRVKRGGSFKRLWLIHVYSYRPDIALASMAEFELKVWVC